MGSRQSQGPQAGRYLCFYEAVLGKRGNYCIELAQDTGIVTCQIDNASNLLPVSIWPSSVGTRTEHPSASARGQGWLFREYGRIDCRLKDAEWCSPLLWQKAQMTVGR